MQKKIENWLKSQESLISFVESFLSLDMGNSQLCLVGGVVRDILLGRTDGKDLDLMIDNCKESQLQNWLKSLKSSEALSSFQKVGKSFPVYILKIPGIEEHVDLSLARRERSTGSGHTDFEIEAEDVSSKEDGERRDFTVNAIFLRFFFEDAKVSCELMDHFSGLADLSVKKLRTVGDPLERMKEDPLRILRALRFVHQRGFSMDSMLQLIIEDNAANLIPHLSPDRIQDEFVRTMMANPQEANRNYLRFDLYQTCFPKLAVYLPQKAEEIFPNEPLEHRDYVTPLLLMPYLEMHHFNLTSAQLKEIEDQVREAHLPNPKQVKQILEGLCTLKARESTNYPMALQEKILEGPNGDYIHWFYVLYQRQGMMAPLPEYPAKPERLDGHEIMSWGFQPGPGFEAIALRTRELQLQGTKDKEQLKGKILFESAMLG